MDILAKTKRETKVYSRPSIDSSIYVESIEANKRIHLVGMQRVGLQTFYLLYGGNYIFGDDVQLLRDLDFYYKNYSGKQLMKSNLNMNGDRGASYLLEVGKPFTTTASLLQRFAGDDEDEEDDINSSVDENGTLIPPQSDSDTKKPSQKEMFYNNAKNMEIGSIIQGNSAVNDALNGLTVGSLFDGTFLRGLAGNLIGMLSKWFNDKLKYVIGFDLSSWDGTLIDLFRKLWDKYASKFLGKWSSLLGGLLFGWLNPTDDSLGLRKVSPDGDLVLEPTGPQFLASYDTTFDSEDGRRYLVATEGDYLGTLGGIEGYYIEGVNPSGPRDKELDLAPFDQKMLEYFSFYLTDEELPPAKKVVDYKLQTEPFAGYESKGEIVLKPEKSKREKSFYESMHDLEYKDFQDALGLVKEEFSIGIERADTITKFNRWRIPTVDNELTSSRGHVFFTRPDLNLAVQIYDNQENVKQSYSSYTPLIFNLLKQHSTLMKYLTGSAVDSHYFIPVLSDRCTGIDVSDEIIDTHEHGQTKTGWKFMYGGSMTKSKTAGTVNVTFTDDDMLSVYKILKVWTEYINAVYKGEMSPKLQYLKNHILDYAISIYYVLTKADGEDVIFFTKYTGCFPTSVPSSNFSDVLGTPIKRPNYTIPFTYARKDDYNPLHIAEFNHLSSADYKYAPVYNNKTARSARSFVGAPFIDTLNGSYSFKLRYRDNSSENGQSALLKTTATNYVKSLF